MPPATSAPPFDPGPIPVYDAPMKPDPALRATQALRLTGVRVTRQREALLKVLTQADDHPDAAELHRRARTLALSLGSRGFWSDALVRALEQRNTELAA